MTAGRPTDYDATVIGEAVISYIGDCKQQFYLPTIAGLAVELSVSRDTIYEWAKHHPEFSDILEQLKALQESMLIQNGLKNEYNSTITKLMLTKHGYHDKQETDVTSKGDKMTFALISYANPDTAQVQPEELPAPSTESTG